MNFDFIDEELTIYEQGTDCTDDQDIFSFTHTLAGNTLMIGSNYFLEESDTKGIYLIKKKGDTE